MELYKVQISERWDYEVEANSEGLSGYGVTRRGLANGFGLDGERRPVLALVLALRQLDFGDSRALQAGVVVLIEL